MSLRTLQQTAVELDRCSGGGIQYLQQKNEAGLYSLSQGPESHTCKANRATSVGNGSCGFSCERGRYSISFFSRSGLETRPRPFRVLIERQRWRRVPSFGSLAVQPSFSIRLRKSDAGTRRRVQPCAQWLIPIGPVLLLPIPPHTPPCSCMTQ